MIAQNRPTSSGSVGVCYAADRTDIQVTHSLESNGWKPCKMGVLANFSVAVLKELGLSTYRINRLAIKYVFVEAGTQTRYDEIRDEASWLGLCMNEGKSQHGGMDWNGNKIPQTHYFTIYVLTTKRVRGEVIPRPLNEVMQTITHELVHVAQGAEDRLHYTFYNKGWKVRYTTPSGATMTHYKEDKAWEDMGHEWEAVHHQRTTLANILNPTHDSLTVRIKGLNHEEANNGGWNVRYNEVRMSMNYTHMEMTSPY